MHPPFDSLSVSQLQLETMNDQKGDRHGEIEDLDSVRVRQLVKDIFRRCLVRLVICHQGCRQEEVDQLKSLEEIRTNVDNQRFVPRWTYGVLCYQERKQKLQQDSRGNHDNLRALLIRDLSHTPEQWGVSEEQAQGPLCPRCGGTIDYSKRNAVLEKIRKGELSLKDLKRVASNPSDRGRDLSIRRSRSQLCGDL